MAIVPSTDYPLQTTTAAAYPQGKAQDVTTPGDGTGTPYTARILNDIWGFLQSLLSAGAVTPSGNPDQVGASDYKNALDALYGAPKVTGPASAADNAITRFDGTSGKLVQSSGLQVDDSAELVYASPPTRITVVPGWEFKPANNTGTYVMTSGFYGGIRVSSNSLGYFAVLSSFLPDGAVVTRVRYMVDPGVARSGTNRTRMVIGKQALSFGTPSIGSFTSVADVYDNAAATLQVISSGTISETINKAGGSALVAQFSAGNDAATNPDEFYGVEIQWTDPGPRNN